VKGANVPANQFGANEVFNVLLQLHSILFRLSFFGQEILIDESRIKKGNQRRIKGWEEEEEV
jgi:hypothetical protein